MDLSKTKSQLKTLFADNFTAEISEQDLRDFVESIFQYGGLSLPANDFVPNPGQLIDDSYTCVNQFLSQSISSPDVQADPNNGTIKILRAGVYTINISLSFSGSANSEWQGSVFKNDLDMEICNFKELLRPLGQISTAGGFDPLLVEANDVLEYRIKSIATNKTFLLESGQFNVFRIG